MTGTPAERAEAARVRRRWITLAEFVGIAGLILSGLALWLSWSDRRADVAQHQVEQQAAQHEKSVVALHASVADGGDALDLSDPAHSVQTIDVTFPSALGASAQTGLVRPRLEADWFAPVLKLAAKGEDVHRGRVPIRISAVWWDGDTKHVDSALYDVAWHSIGHFLGGRAIKLDGMALRERSATDKTLDAAWASEMPKAK